MTKKTVIENKANTPMPLPVSATTDKLIEDLKKQEKILAKEIGGVEKSTMKVMFALHAISDGNLYQAAKDAQGKAYKNIYDYAFDKYGISRGTCSEYINVIERFGERDELGQFTGNIIDRFSKYRTSVLARLQSFILEDVDLMISDYGLTEKTSFRKVADIIREYKKDEIPEQPESKEKPEKANITTGSEPDAEPNDNSDNVPDAEPDERKIHIGSLICRISSKEDFEKVKDVVLDILKSGSCVDLYRFKEM